MAKRRTGVGKPVRSHSDKTTKRLEVKKAMLEEKAAKRKRCGRVKKTTAK